LLVDWTGFALQNRFGSASFYGNWRWKHFGPDFRKRKSGLEAKILRILAGFDRNPGFQNFHFLKVKFFGKIQMRFSGFFRKSGFLGFWIL